MPEHACVSSFGERLDSNAARVASPRMMPDAKRSRQKGPKTPAPPPIPADLESPALPSSSEMEVFQDIVPVKLEVGSPVAEPVQPEEAADNQLDESVVLEDPVVEEAEETFVPEEIPIGGVWGLVSQQSSAPKRCTLCLSVAEEARLLQVPLPCR